MFFDSTSSSPTSQTQNQMYAEGYGLNVSGSKGTNVAMPDSWMVSGKGAKSFMEGGGSDYSGKGNKVFAQGGGSDYSGASLVYPGGVSVDGAGNTVNISAPDQMFSLLDTVITGYQEQSRAVMAQVGSLQGSADERYNEAVELTNRQVTTTGETQAFLKAAVPYAFVAAAIYFVGKAFIK